MVPFPFRRVGGTIAVVVTFLAAPALAGRTFDTTVSGAWTPSEIGNVCTNACTLGYTNTSKYVAGQFLCGIRVGGSDLIRQNGTVMAIQVTPTPVFRFETNALNDARNGIVDLNSTTLNSLANRACRSTVRASYSGAAQRSGGNWVCTCTSSADLVPWPDYSDATETVIRWMVRARVRNFADLQSQTEFSPSMMRNTMVAELAYRLSDSVSSLSARTDADLIQFIALQALLRNRGTSDATLKTLRADDLRNTTIALLNSQTGYSVAYLQGQSNLQIADTFLPR